MISWYFTISKYPIFRLKKENEAIKNRIVRGIRNLFEHEKDYYKPQTVANFWSNNYMNMSVTVIEIKYYQLENILIKSDHT